MSRRVLSYVLVVLITLVLSEVFHPLAALQTLAQGTQGCRTFEATGKTVCGRFLQYWADHGGIVQQGYPITGEFQEVSDLNGQTYTVQYFERAVFEYHPENVPPYDVLLSQFGTIQLREKYNGHDPSLGGTPVPTFQPQPPAQPTQTGQP